jgi:hypothetical protein
VALKVELVSMKRCSGLLERACISDADCESAMPGTGTCIEHSDVGAAGPWWVQAPEQVQLGCLPGPCGDEDWIARVDSDPFFDVWTLDTLHVGDCEMVPVATYAIRACTPPDGTICSAPLTIGTIAQPFISPGFRGNCGDVVGPVIGINPEYYFTPPDGFVTVVDITGYVLTKQNYGTANKPQAHPTWIDLHGLGDGEPVCTVSGEPCFEDVDCLPDGGVCRIPGNGRPPNYILNVSDLQQILKGLANHPWVDGSAYINPGECP